MRIGVPKEIKEAEGRVGLIPASVKALVARGHSVLVEKGAGAGSGFSDDDYIKAGAVTVADAAEVYGAADMIVKVKEPLASEYNLLQPGQVLFTYLHLAANRELTEALMARRVVAISYETIELSDGSLPLLVPMSEIAGRMSTQIGARLLESPSGGRGLLLGGVPGVAPAHVVIVGGGVVGTNAAKIAVGMGARVTILDKSLARLRYLDDIFGKNVETLYASEDNVANAVASADLLIGAVLIKGARAPRVVTEQMVAQMSPGSVIVDVAIDQGGCIETIDRATTHYAPTYVKHGVIHYSVANIPGCVARTSTLALNNATLPYVLQLADKGWKRAVKEDKALAAGVNVVDGHVTYRGVAESIGVAYTPLDTVLS